MSMGRGFAMTSIARWALSLAAAALMMGLVLVQAARAQEAAGEWHGVLSAGGSELRLGLTLTAKPGGGFEGAMTSPDQTPRPMPVADVKLEGSKLSFTVPSVRGRYEATWEAGKWVGTWNQVAPLPLVLEKGPIPTLKRAQVPAKPYPYREEDVAFESAPGVKLAGTLTLPRGKGPFPAAVLITGSGAQDRDETLAGHKPFLVLADHLTRKGIAVLRYDDRGFAKSTGVFATATSEDFTVDALAAAAFLRGRPEIDPRRVGLIGHSEGGMVAPMAAVQDPRIAWIVLMAGPGAPIRQLMSAQRAAAMGAMGLPPQAIAAAEATMGRVDDAVLASKDAAEARAAVTTILTESAGPMQPRAAVAMQAGQVSTNWYRFFIAYDPRPVLAQVKQPVLAINGEKDVQVVASQNLPAIAAALKGNHDVTVVALPGLNHLFQTAKTGLPEEYGRIEETMSPKALEVISGWVLKRSGQ